jgi:RNA polymerase sigma factor (sigma-70 family)
MRTTPAREQGHASESELHAAWAAGDRRAGARLVDRHLPSIARFFANKVANGADAEDLVAETFERWAASLDRFRGEGSVRAFVYGIAHNVLRDYLRRLARGRATSLETTSIRDLAESPSVRVARREDTRLLLAALRSVPMHTQIVLELSLFEELGRSEISEILGVPPGTVASRLRRGRAQLHERLETLASTRHLLETTLRGLGGWVADVRDHLDELAPTDEPGAVTD